MSLLHLHLHSSCLHFNLGALSFPLLLPDLGLAGVAPPSLPLPCHLQISDVQFVSASSSPSSAESSASSSDGGSGLLLLTAGNDATVCLWDLGRSAEAAGGRGLVPQCLAKATDLHSGEFFFLFCFLQLARELERRCIATSHALSGGLSVPTRLQPT
jgi:hypothetical protein